MLKRFFSILSISLIITGGFFSSYCYEYPVYADSTTDSWTQVTTNEQLVEAFKYYCKSRDLTIEGSIADGVTKFTTKTFNGLCNTLGIDVTALQAQLKYRTDSNIGIQFLFSDMGISAYNRIFSQFLQDNDLSVGDENVDKQIYNGHLFTDADGNTCIVYETTRSNNWISPSNVILGTPYKYTSSEVRDLFSNVGNGGSLTFTFNLTSGLTDSRAWYHWIGNGYDRIIRSSSAGNYTDPFYLMNSNNVERIGNTCIIYNTSANTLYFGFWQVRYSDNMYYLTEIRRITDTQNNQPLTINIVSNTINNNTYEGDTIINNEGDVINNNYPDPNPNPTPDPPTLPDDGGWQDFTLPDMPNDWLIYGMEKKFPFDIPFNIMFALSLLNHEPETPKFEGDLDLQVCTWHYDIDLTPFDDIAAILRKFEVLAFIIGLAILTKNLINWG